MKEIILKELSYQIVGICFKIHSEMGRFCREKQYGDELESILKEKKISYNRELSIHKLIDSPLGNRPDFIINNEIIVDLKAKPTVTREDYYQMQRYLQASNKKLGLIINFQVLHLRPKRIINYQINS